MRIVVTDLTRFQNKELLCLAGLAEDGQQCVRPLLATNQAIFHSICAKN